MEWRDRGIVLGVRKQGETSVVLELMTASHGRHLGLVRGGRSRRLRAVLQLGNLVEVNWRARLDEHLGFMTVEPLLLRAGLLMESAMALQAVQLLAAHVRLLPERDDNPRLFALLDETISHLDEPQLGAIGLFRFEVALLEELGFGLDLDSCAAGGSDDDLAFVSPRTGRAVSREKGEPFADRLLPYPGLLRARRNALPDADDLAEAFRTTGYFLARHVWEPRNLAEPDARAGVVSAFRRQQPALV
ncbi:DNA repair protein RecO [Aureimonas sp. AU4]|uniref:DNA repair protein RecO n=1 Tax=Aureimonas sp. AU4 TaxID=1638163 RepID=UPI0007836743|nr:DNA repair protein RecO [Aureimonas sp. AU4]